MKSSFVVVDIETTGISPEVNMITEIGALKIVNDKIVGEFSQLINPHATITPEITALTGLTNERLMHEPTIEEVLPEFLAFNEDLPLLGHNILFDYSFLKYQANKIGHDFERTGIDTLRLASYYVPDLRSKSLASLIEFFDIQREIAHRAFHDAKATYEVYRYFKDKYMRENEEAMFLPFPLRWKPKKQSPITSKQKSFLAALIKKHQMYTDVNIDELTKSEASKYIDKILFTKGRS